MVTKLNKDLKAAADTKEVATVTPGAMPAYLKGKEVKSQDWLEASDLILPRVKLLQGISSEVEAFETAKAGLFWHNILNEVIGPEFSFIVSAYRKKYMLMAPLSDSRGVLARAEDGVHWTPPNATFEVKLKGIKETQKWTTKPTVAESRLAEFGSSVTDDPDSKPAAVLMYEYLIILPDFPQYTGRMPIIMTLARSQAKKAKDLNSKIEFRGAPLNSMRFKATVTEESGDEGPYKNYSFLNDGWATEEEFNRAEDYAKKFGHYRAADDEGAVHEGEPAKADSKEF